MEIVEILPKYGITNEILVMLLFVPVVATVVNFSRYVIGFKTLGIYAPLTLAFAYVFTGIRFGLLITFAVIAATLLSYYLLKRIRMHYLARVSINYTIITVFIILILVINEVSPLSITTEQHDTSTLPPLGILLIATLSDFFIKQYIKSNIINSVRSLLETVVIGVIGWFLIRNDALQNFMLQNMWVLLIVLMINLVLGKYTGLRLKELARFKNVVKGE